MTDQGSAPPRVSSQHRIVLQCLLPGRWEIAARLPVPVTDRLIDVMSRREWIEQRSEGSKVEIKITQAGREAMAAKI